MEKKDLNNREKTQIVHDFEKAIDFDKICTSLAKGPDFIELVEHSTFRTNVKANAEYSENLKGLRYYLFECGSAEQHFFRMIILDYMKKLYLKENFTKLNSNQQTKILEILYDKNEPLERNENKNFNAKI